MDLFWLLRRHCRTGDYTRCARTDGIICPEESCDIDDGIYTHQAISHPDSPRGINMNLKPLRTNLLLIPDEPRAKTLSGLFIPDDAKEQPVMGTVVAVGPAVTTVKMRDHVLYTKFSGTDIVIDDVKMLLVDEDQIVGIVED